MNITHSYVVSLCAWIAIFVNGLVLYRFNPIRYWKEILLISVFTSSFSVILQYLNMIVLITFLPLVLALVFFTAVMRFSWLHSLTMIAVGATISGFLEFLVSYVLSNFDIHLTMAKIANDYSKEAWYFVSLHFLLSLYLYKMRIGFTSIRKYQRPKLNDKLLLFIFVFSVCNSIAGMIIVFMETSVFMFLLFLFVLFIAYMMYSYVKELKDD